MIVFPIVFSFMPCQKWKDFVLYYYLDCYVYKGLPLINQHKYFPELSNCSPVIGLCIIYTLQHNCSRNDRIVSFLISSRINAARFCSFLVTRDIFPISRSNNIERWKKGRSLQKKIWLRIWSLARKEEGKKSFMPLLGHYYLNHYYSAVGW